MLILPVAMMVVPIYDLTCMFMPKTKRFKSNRDNLDGWLKSWLKCTQEMMGNTTKHRRSVKRRNCMNPLTGRRKRGFRLSRTIPGTLIASLVASSGDLAAKRMAFDTDSKVLKIDNHASRSITNDINDVVGAIDTSNTYRINGVGGSIPGYECTVKWSIEDDLGRSHDVILPGAIYARKSPARILSPQHWAQEAKDNHPKRRGTWCATYGDEIVLHWDQERYKRSVTLDKKGSNVATICTSPGFNKFESFQSESGLVRDELFCYDSRIISDDEGDDQYTPVSESNEVAIKATTSTQNQEEVWKTRPDPLMTDFNLQQSEEEGQEPPVHVIVDEEDSKYQDSSSEFLQWHHKLGHISPKKIREMARRGRLPSKLAHCKVPLCTSCLYGKATKRPWRSKESNQPRKMETITQVGQCVSVDQIESFTPGLIAQMKGTPTKSRYHCATVFVDQKSGFGYVHLQRSTTGDETIEAKQAFERYAHRYGVHIAHYHADNGRFAERKFLDHVASAGQTISFSGVGAHFQNGVAERRIRELQEHARTMLIHARTRWPEAITVHLWPYALRTANDILNSTWDLKRKHVSLEKFTSTPVQDNLKHWAPFGCPVYVVEKAIQDGKSFNKWKTKARVAIYIGRSPNHARSVAMCLSLQTGLVSPQFHFRLDPTFQTMRKAFRISMPISEWQSKCHFASGKVSLGTSVEQGNRGKKSNTQASATNSTTEDISGNTQQMNQQAETVEADLQDRHEEDHVPMSVQTTTRSGRQTRRPKRYLDAFTSDVTLDPFCPIDDIATEIEAFTASSNPDMLYLHQAMKEPDWDEFRKAMDIEINGQSQNNNWEVVRRNQVPEGAQIVPAVWALRRKRRIKTQEVYKWKARLNVDGSKQIKGVSFWETYSPVVAWPVVRLLLALVLIMNWHSMQIDFVQAYPQAPAETDLLYIEIPKGYEIEGAKKGEFVLKIKQNVYGQRQAGRVWNLFLVEKLMSIGFERSKVDDCIFYRGNVIYALYVDDSIITGPSKDEIDQVVKDMRSTGLELTIEGDLADFLGVNIDRKDDGSIHLTQPHLINSILKDLNMLNDNVKPKDTPAKVKVLLKRHLDEEKHDDSFPYRSIIGKLNYLEKSSRPDISYAVHQCARFSQDPRKSHAAAVRWLGRYLAGTKDKGIIFKPNGNSFVCFVDADFVGNWDPEGDPKNDPDTARSRTGYVATLAGCPVLYASRLQSVITLSSSESEFVALSTALRDIIPAMNLLKEMDARGLKVPGTQPQVHCRVFEDNSGALEMAVNEKYRPRTKHVNAKFHHFRSYVDSGDIAVKPIKSESQPADYLTKSLSAEVIRAHRLTIQGW